jgi:two-component system phosphate regulon sensor histidine kinase PhoR
MAHDTSIDYQHFFKELLEVVPQPVLIVDRSLSIIDYNTQAAHLFDSKEPLQGLKLNQVVQNEIILQLVQESIASEETSRGEYNEANIGTTWEITVAPLEHKSPKTKPPKSSKHVKHKYRYYAIIIDDLTELRRLERVRRDFVANISHELRTPLASVRLLAETLEEAIDTDHEKAEVFVEKIENEVEHLSTLVADLLELSRIESGYIPMSIQPVAAEQLVREAMARMLPLAQRQRVALRTEIKQGKTLVAADSKQIMRVLVNLVHNAIKFTPSGGQVVIGTKLQGEKQCFFVRDTGVGIRAEELPRIFERFYKVNRSRSKVDFIGSGGGGTGLGLAIARHIVEAHGGRITAESTVGEGSTFTLTLPVVTRTK